MASAASSHVPFSSPSRVGVLFRLTDPTDPLLVTLMILHITVVDVDRNRNRWGAAVAAVVVAAGGHRRTTISGNDGFILGCAVAETNMQEVMGEQVVVL